MAKSELQFGMIRIILEDDRSDSTTLTNLAFATITSLLPEAKKIAKEEHKQMFEKMKLVKNQAVCDCETCEDSDVCVQNPKKLDEIKNLYI